MKKIALILGVSISAFVVTSCGPSDEELKEMDKKMEAEKFEGDKEFEKEMESMMADGSDTTSNDSAKTK